MTPEELGALLDELGRRLGPGGEYVFRIAVQKALISAWLGLLLVGLPAALVAVWGWRHAIKGWRVGLAGGNPFREHWDDEAAASQAIAGTAIGFCATALALVFVLNAIPSILLPEYTALRDILSAIGVDK